MVDGDDVELLTAKMMTSIEGQLKKYFPLSVHMIDV